MTQAMTERATGLFTVKEHRDGTPFIRIELDAPGLKAMQGGFLSLELRDGRSIEEVKALAGLLNAQVGEISHTQLGG